MIVCKRRAPRQTKRSPAKVASQVFEQRSLIIRIELRGPKEELEGCFGFVDKVLDEILGSVVRLAV
jgi:hypothetical protein